MHVFSNNARSTLAQAALSSDATLVCKSDGSAETLANITYADPTNSWESHDFQHVTLTHPDHPGLYEIVAVIQRSGDTLTVVRGHEGTVARDWPVATRIEARITADMLQSFPQRQREFLRTNPANSTALDMFSIGDYLAIPRVRMKSTDGVYYGWHAGGLGAEVCGVSVPCDIGETPTWVGGTLYAGEVVAPPTPDGFQYWLELPMPGQSVASSTLPAFAGDAAPTVAHDSYSAHVGYWVATSVPVETEIIFHSGTKLAVTEVGFIADIVTANSAPTVSIGGDGVVGRFASGVQLDQLVGNDSIHRIPVSAGGSLVSSLQFSVTAAASGGRMRGRFYWRGVMVAGGA